MLWPVGDIRAIERCEILIAVLWLRCVACHFIALRSSIVYGHPSPTLSNDTHLCFMTDMSMSPGLFVAEIAGRSFM